MLLHVAALKSTKRYTYEGNLIFPMVCVHKSTPSCQAWQILCMTSSSPPMILSSIFPSSSVLMPQFLLIKITLDVINFLLNTIWECRSFSLAIPCICSIWHTDCHNPPQAALEKSVAHSKRSTDCSTCILWKGVWAFGCRRDCTAWRKQNNKSFFISSHWTALQNLWAQMRQPSITCTFFSLISAGNASGNETHEPKAVHKLQKISLFCEPLPGLWCFHPQNSACFEFLELWSSLVC